MKTSLKNQHYLLILLLGLLLQIPQEAFSQFDSGDSIYQEDTTLTRLQLNKVVINQFSSLLTGQTTHSTGGFAGVDIENKEVTFTPNFIFDKLGHVLVVEAKAGINDGVSTIFENTELSTKFSLGGNYHILSSKKPKTIVYDYWDFKSYKDRDKEIQSQHTLDVLKTKNKQDFKVAELKVLNLQKKIKDAEDKLKKLKTNQQKLPKDIEQLRKKITALEATSRPINETKKEIDALRLTIRTHELELSEIPEQVMLLEKQLDIHKFNLIPAEAELNEIVEEMKNPDWEGEQMLFVAGNKRADALTENDISKLKLYAFKMNWWSFGYNLNFDKFKLFAPADSFSAQITDTSYTSHEFSVQHSWYNWNINKHGSYFATVKGTYAYTHNFSGLNDFEITETIQHGTAAGDRVSTETYTAYAGDYNSGLHSFRLQSDLYYFFPRTTVVGVHLFPDGRIMEKQYPVWSLGAGLVLEFKNKEKDKSAVNAELFYNLVDLFNTGDADEKLFQRNNIGIRFTMPINFHPNKI